MDASDIVYGTNFDTNVVSYTTVKQNSQGGKMVNIRNKKSGLVVMTPLMLTWGASDYEGNKKFEMSLQFPSEGYTNDDSTAFFEAMRAFEDKLKADAIVNAKEWFGKQKMSSEVIDALWTPMLKYPKNKDTGEPDTSRSPMLRVKIPYYDGEWRTEVYSTDGETQLFPDSATSVTPVDLISKGTHLGALIECGGLWFANGKFGVTWRLVQAMVQPRKTLRGKCHIKLNLDDKKKMEESTPDQPAEDTMVESDTEEVGDVEVEVEEDTPPIVEPKKKKVIRKKP